MRFHYGWLCFDYIIYCIYFSFYNLFTKLINKPNKFITSHVDHQLTTQVNSIRPKIRLQVTSPSPSQVYHDHYQQVTSLGSDQNISNDIYYNKDQEEQLHS